MNTRSLVRMAPAFLAAALFLAGCAGRSSPVASAAPTFPDPPDADPPTHGMQVAVLAGGCFWGMQAIYERLKGVSDVLAGYSGGAADTAHYEIVSTGTTGHAESIQVTYDPAVISYGTILKVFFSVAHDPTELNYQGPDVGTQYRTVIFYANDDQKKQAEDYIQLLDKDHVYPNAIVTQVVPLKTFYPAEDYHQHFFDNNPTWPYIYQVDRPKVINLERTYPDLLSGKYAKLAG